MKKKETRERVKIVNHLSDRSTIFRNEINVKYICDGLWFEEHDI